MAVFADIEREIFADFDALSGPDASKALAKLAADERHAVIAADNPSTVNTWVDGRQGAGLESVAPNGMIRFEFEYLTGIAQYIWDTLRQKSPFREKRAGANPPTHYRDEHVMLINGAETEDVPETLPPDSEIVFVNLQPYARKVEKGFSLQAPNGVYEAVAGLARRRFGNQAQIAFEYREFAGLGPMSMERREMVSKSKRQAADRFPSIIVKGLIR